jgi:hypothetical protein
MSEVLQEYIVASGRPLTVEGDGSVLRGVKLLGLTSRNGRIYRPAALEGAIPLYEGAKVNVNHPKGDPLSPRDYQDRLGSIRGVEFRPTEGLFGDLHFNPKHALAEQLAWDAANASENLGLSHNVVARTTRTGDDVVVEEILKVQSIDVVADPASTRGLFEQQGEAAEPVQEETQRATRRSQIAQVLVEFGLPSVYDDRPAARKLTSPLFLELLETAPSLGDMRRLAADRAALVELGPLLETLHQSTQRATAREQRWFDFAANRAEDAQSFVSAIRR